MQEPRPSRADLRRILRQAARQDRLDLRAFNSLESLRMPVFLLFGLFSPQAVDLTEVLPQSLRSLSLIDDLAHYPFFPRTKEIVKPFLQNFLQQATTSRPLLQQIDLFLWKKDINPNRMYQNKRSTFRALVRQSQISMTLYEGTPGSGWPW